MKRFKWNLGVIMLRISYKIRGEIPQKKYFKRLPNKINER